MEDAVVGPCSQGISEAPFLDGLSDDRIKYMVGVDVEMVGCGILPGVTVVESHGLAHLVIDPVLGTVEAVDHGVAAVRGSGQAVTELALELEVLYGLEFSIYACLQRIELLDISSSVEVVKTDRVLGVGEELPSASFAASS